VLLKRLFICFIVCLSVVSAHTQISISASSLPDFGDKIFYKTDIDPKVHTHKLKTNGTLWNYEDLNGGARSEYSFHYPRYGQEKIENNSFDILLKKDQSDLNWLRWNGNDLEIVASMMDDKVSGNERMLHIFKGRAPFIFGMLDYRDRFTKEVSSIYKYKVSELPFNIRQTDLFEADSLRIEVHTTYFMDVDDFGTLRLPKMESEVLQLSIIKKITTSFSILKNSNWVDFGQPTFLTEYFPDNNSQIIEKHFYSETGKTPIAIAIEDETGRVISVTYQTSFLDKIESSSENLRNGLDAYPNPTYGDVSFNFSQYPAGKYKVNLYNIIGISIWEKLVSVKQNEIVNVDFNFLTKGTYIYSIENATGEKLITKRLVIITP